MSSVDERENADLWRLHAQAFDKFLNELYAIMVDPCAEGSMKREAMMQALKDAALRDREASVSATREQDPYKRNPEVGKCSCGQHDVPAGCDGVQWYWQRHAREACTLELPNKQCWCGLLRSEHITGHKEGAARPLDSSAKTGRG